MVLLINNGCLALADELEERFPGCSSTHPRALPRAEEKAESSHPKEPPFTLVLGSTTHGAYCPKEVSAGGGEVVVHAGFGRVWFGLPAMAPRLPELSPKKRGENHIIAAGRVDRVAIAAARVRAEARAEQSVKLIAQSGLIGEDAAVVGLDPFIEQRLWEKLCANAVLNPLTALWRCENGAVLARSDGRALARAIAGEVAAVARAREEAKAAINSCDEVPSPCVPSATRDPSRGLLSNPLSTEALYAFVEACAAENAKNKSSMLMDVAMGRRTETAYLGGWVAREGRRLHVSTPVNEALTGAIQRLEAGEECVDMKFSF